MSKKHIMWTNKFSGETGFVGKVSKKDGCFYNAAREDAKSYASDKAAAKDIEILEEVGEAKNNNFEIVEF